MKIKFPITLADSEKDPDFTEGKTVGGYKVRGTALQVQKQLEGLGITTMLGGILSDGCVISISFQRDREAKNKPLVFGKIEIVGESEELVEKVLGKVREVLPDAGNEGGIEISTF